jgi:hypothetical protein
MRASSRQRAGKTLRREGDIDDEAWLRGTVGAGYLFPVKAASPRKLSGKQAPDFREAIQPVQDIIRTYSMFLVNERYRTMTVAHPTLIQRAQPQG